QAAGASVAMKVLLPERRGDRHALTRLKREFLQMQCLTHSGIARVFDLDCDADVWFMSMELVIGQTVSRWMQQPVDLRHRLMLIGACCEALEHAHSIGILHGDLKPSNVLVAHDRDVKLIDFGSAPRPVAGADLSSASTTDPSLAITPSYASPQVLAGSGVEKRDDIFSLACLSYGILAHGRHPFDGRSSLDAYRAGMCPAPVPAIPERLFEALMRGLAPEREQRASSVREFLDGLMAADPNRCAVSMIGTAGTAAPPRQEPSTLAVPAQVAPATASEPAAPVAPVRMRPAVGRQIAAMASSVGSARSMSLAALVLVIVWSVLQFGQMAPGSATSATTVSRKPAAPVRSAPPAVAAVPPKAALVALQPGAFSDPVPVAPPKRPVVHAPGAITFESSRVVVQAAQPLVAIPVRRLHATRGVGAVAWAVESGTAHPGVDYKLAGPKVIRFIEGQTVRILYIPLIRSGVAAARGPRNFVVTLRRVAGGPALGPVPRVTVTIAAPQGISGSVADGTSASAQDAGTSASRPVRGELTEQD
ncbi:MAG: serine/threonine protein kinase, partial [Steroidobacteraceae bacterium]